ncbi:pimeloyl-ACP methyl ester carboxylesterase [Bradyrhizobium japonicum]|uniref:alpha/beta hydrolase family protein n=1 Tax=Bradyrhizobium japonicum TaxID=375 RepID=UPI0033974BA3
MKKLSCAAAAVSGLFAASVSAEMFPPETLLSGYTVSEQACKAQSSSVWVVVDGKGDCIRYYAAGLSSGSNKYAIFYLHGDRLWGANPISYDDNDSAKQQAKIDDIQKEVGLPFIMVARPGTYGSSGSHVHRREKREVMLNNAAIAALRKRYAIEHAAVTGQSGGGANAAYVLTQQPDLSCVVLTSSALSMNTILAADVKSIYDTSNSGLYDPIQHVAEVKPNDARKVFVIGMEGDKFSPFANQKEFAEALKAKGHNVFLIHGKAAGSYGHTLDRTGRTVSKWCLTGIPVQEIIERVEKHQVEG